MTTPLIVVVLPGWQALVPDDDPPLAPGSTIKPLPLPPLPKMGVTLPVPPVTVCTGALPPLVTPLLGVLDVPQAIEPSSATPVHKEKGRVFMSDFLRSIGGRPRGGCWPAHAQALSAGRCGQLRNGTLRSRIDRFNA